MTVETEKLRIRLNFSFAATVTLMLCFCEERVVLIALLASFLHESGHILLLILFGCTPVSVTLSAFGMCIDRPPHSGLSLKKEIAVAMGGILFNLSAAIIFLLMSLVYPTELFSFAFAVNLTVALINSVPNISLDLGRAAYYFLLTFKEEEKAERIMNALSSAFALLTALFFILYTVFEKLNISLAVVTLYIVILTFKREVDK
jgi:hypothetical protein